MLQIVSSWSNVFPQTLILPDARPRLMDLDVTMITLNARIILKIGKEVPQPPRVGRACCHSSFRHWKHAWKLHVNGLTQRYLVFLHSHLHVLIIRLVKAGATQGWKLIDRPKSIE